VDGVVSVVGVGGWFPGLVLWRSSVQWWMCYQIAGFRAQ
jgi:hypothetical protein